MIVARLPPATKDTQDTCAGINNIGSKRTHNQKPDHFRIGLTPIEQAGPHLFRHILMKYLHLFFCTEFQPSGVNEAVQQQGSPWKAQSWEYSWLFFSSRCWIVFKGRLKCGVLYCAAHCISLNKKWLRHDIWSFWSFHSLCLIFSNFFSILRARILLILKDETLAKWEAVRKDMGHFWHSCWIISPLNNELL